MREWRNEDPRERVHIPWSYGEGWLNFSDPVEVPESSLSYPELSAFTITAVNDGLRATARVDADDHYWDFGQVALFFADMAYSWRGWEGEKQGLFGDILKISATHDGLARVRMRCTLNAEPVTGWRVENVSVAIEIGHLE